MPCLASGGAITFIFMKKLFIFAAVALAMASCTTMTKTARTESIPYAMYNANVADLEVGSRISYTLSPNKSIRRGGVANCKKAAIQEALAANGNADLLVEPQFVIQKKDGIFQHRVVSVTVSGRPAKYKNFRSLNDSVWTDPVFRGVKGTTFHIFKGARSCKK